MKDINEKILWRACNKISSALFRVDLNLEDHFQIYDPSKQGKISETKFITILRGPLKFALGLSEAEIAELTDYFRLHDGKIHYSQLLEVVHNNVPKFQTKNIVTGLEWDDPIQINRLSSSEMKRLNLILTQIAVNVNQRKMILQPYFQDYEMIAKEVGTVSINHFGRILNHLGITLASDEFGLVVKRFVKNSILINYVSFIDAIEEIRNYMKQHGMSSISGDLLNQFPGRIITAQLPKLPRPELGKVLVSDVFNKQSSFHPVLDKKLPSMPLKEIIKRVQKHVLEQRLRVNEFFQHFDVMNVGRLTVSQFKRGLDALEISSLGRLYLSEREIEELTNFYKDPNDCERVLWRSFVHDVDEVFNMKELEKSSCIQVESSSNDVMELPKRGLRSWENTDKELRDLCEETLQRIRHRVEERRIMLKPFFKNYDKLNHGHVSRNQMRQIFPAATVLLSPEETFALEQRYNDEIGFNYSWFLRELESSPIAEPLYEEMLQTMLRLNADKPKVSISDDEKDIELILTKIKTKVVRERIQMKDFLRQYDPRNKMVISRHDFTRGLDQIRCNLSQGELETLMNVFKDPLRPKFIEYMRFSKSIEEAISIECLEKSPMQIPIPHIPSESCPRAFLNFDERQLMTQAMDKLVKIKNPNLEEVFKDYDKQNMGTVTKNQLMRILSTCKMLFMLSNNELNALYKSFAVESRDNQLRMNYRSFLHALELVRINKKYLPF